jgi:hypothetical protein
VLAIGNVSPLDANRASANSGTRNRENFPAACDPEHVDFVAAPRLKPAK